MRLVLAILLLTLTVAYCWNEAEHNDRSDVGRRGRPELRSGPVWSADSDELSRRIHYEHLNHARLNTATWGRVPDPWYRRSESPRTRVQIPVTAAPSYSYPSSMQARSLNTNPYSVGTDDFEGWEVASRGDNHISYRLRGQSNGYQGQLRQMGEGEGQVSARVVDLRSGTGREDPYSHHRGRAYWPTLTQTQYHRPQTRSMDSVPVQQGDWVKTMDTGTHVTWEKVESPGTEMRSLSPRPAAMHTRTYQTPWYSTRTLNPRPPPARVYYRDHYVPATPPEMMTARPISR